MVARMVASAPARLNRSGNATVVVQRDAGPSSPTSGSSYLVSLVHRLSAERDSTGLAAVQSALTAAERRLMSNLVEIRAVVDLPAAFGGRLSLTRDEVTSVMEATGLRDAGTAGEQSAAGHSGGPPAPPTTNPHWERTVRDHTRHLMLDSLEHPEGGGPGPFTVVGPDGAPRPVSGQELEALRTTKKAEFAHVTGILLGALDGLDQSLDRATGFGRRATSRAAQVSGHNEFDPDGMGLLFLANHAAAIDSLTQRSPRLRAAVTAAGQLAEQGRFTAAYDQLSPLPQQIRQAQQDWAAEYDDTWAAQAGLALAEATAYMSVVILGTLSGALVLEAGAVGVAGASLLGTPQVTAVVISAATQAAAASAVAGARGLAEQAMGLGIPQTPADWLEGLTEWETSFLLNLLSARLVPGLRQFLARGFSPELAEVFANSLTNRSSAIVGTVVNDARRELVARAAGNPAALGPDPLRTVSDHVLEQLTARVLFEEVAGQIVAARFNPVHSHGRPPADSGQSTEHENTGTGSGAARGRFVYPLTGSTANRQALTRTILELGQNLRYAQNAVVTTDTARADTTGVHGLILRVPLASGTPTPGSGAHVEVAVQIEYLNRQDWNDRSALIRGPHGRENTGPARLRLQRGPGNTWHAAIRMHEELHPDDARDVLMHELDETAVIVSRSSAAGTADTVIAAESAANVFRPGRLNASSGQPSLTAHDIAAGRELLRLAERYDAASQAARDSRGRTMNEQALSNAQAHLDRALESMGLRLSEPDFDLRMRLLNTIDGSEVAHNAVDLAVFSRGPRLRTNYHQPATNVVGASATLARPAAGHALASHGISNQLQLDIVNAPERVYTGYYSTGRHVDIYFRSFEGNGHAVITEHGRRNVVITAYDEVTVDRWEDPHNWGPQERYTPVIDHQPLDPNLR